MGSTPSAAASKDDNPAETPEPSSNSKAGDQAGDRPRARKKKSTAKKKAVTKKAARKAAAASKTATRKKASGKSAGGKSSGSKTAARKASAKKAVRKKAAGRKSASKKADSEKKTTAIKKTTSRSRKRPGLAGITATKSPGEVADKAAATSGDPRSLSWMAASAVEALNAVKAHQAEKATHIRETRVAESGLPEAELDDIYADDPDASSPQEMATGADGRQLTAGVGVEPVQAQHGAGETLASATPAVAQPEAETPVPEADTSPGSAAEAPAGEAAASAGLEISPPVSPVSDVEETQETESAVDTARVDSLASAAEVVDIPTDKAPGTEIPPESADEGTVVEDESTEKPVSEPGDEDTVGKPRPLTADGEGKDEPAVPGEESAELPEQVSKPVTAPPPPPPVQRRGMPVRTIAVAVVLGLAVLFGYRFMVDEDEMTAPVADMTADESPGAELDRPPVSVVPVTAETVEEPAAVPSEKAAAARVSAEEPAPAGGSGSQADVADAETPGDISAETELPASATDVTAETAAAIVDVPPVAPSPEPVATQEVPVSTNVPAGLTAPEPVVRDETPAYTDVPSGGSAEAGDSDKPRPVAQATDAVPAPAADAEPAPAEPARATVPAARQPAYRQPGYGYYPRGWQQPSYGYPGWQSPPAGR